MVRSRQAEDDLIEIWLHIARENPPAADQILERIEATFQTLAAYPMMGPARPDLRADLRYFVAGHYLILYRAQANGVEIVRVLHGARHVPNLLPPE